MMIQKIKRMIEISRPLLAFDHWPRFYRFSRGLELSLLKMLSRKIFFDHFATNWRLLYFEYPDKTSKVTTRVEYHHLLETEQNLSWILMWKVGPAEVLVAESA